MPCNNQSEINVKEDAGAVNALASLSSVEKTTPPFLSLTDVSVRLGERTILSDINVSLFANDFIVLEGENGAGKSTLVATLLGLIAPEKGTRTVDESHCNGIGFLSQSNSVPEDFPASVREVVATGALRRRGFKPWLGKKERDLLEHVLTRFNLVDLKDRSLRTLSGGQRRRALIARAYLASSRFMVLDEPTAGLDRLSAQHVVDLLVDLHKTEKTTIFLITHDSDVLNRLKHLPVRWLRLEKGTLTERHPINQCQRCPYSQDQEGRDAQ